MFLKSEYLAHEQHTFQNIKTYTTMWVYIMSLYYTLKK